MQITTTAQTTVKPTHKYTNACWKDDRRVLFFFSAIVMNKSDQFLTTHTHTKSIGKNDEGEREFDLFIWNLFVCVLFACNESSAMIWEPKEWATTTTTAAEGKKHITWLMNELKISIDLCLCLVCSSLCEDWACFSICHIYYVFLFFFSDLGCLTQLICSLYYFFFLRNFKPLKKWHEWEEKNKYNLNK